MEYKGNLYGKVGNSYIPLVQTTYGVEAMEEHIKDLKAQIEQLKQANGAQPEQRQLTIPGVITPLLTDKEIEECVWEDFALPLSKIDVDTNSSIYQQYLEAVRWAKWARDNSNGL